MCCADIRSVYKMLKQKPKKWIKICYIISASLAFLAVAFSNLIDNEQYHYDEIKSKYPDTYDFLMSLNDRLLTIAHYP